MCTNASLRNPPTENAAVLPPLEKQPAFLYDECDGAVIAKARQAHGKCDEAVFIGYPIWWGIAAWPVNGFINANDFTGKTVIPFASSASSGMGESGTLLAGAAGTGDWQEGTRFSSGVSQDAVVEWVEGLGL